MTRVVFCLLVAAWMTTGCAWFGGSQSAKRSSTAKPPQLTNATGTNVTVTPDSSPTGNVATVNASARFAVLNFPVGNLPLKGQHLYVYRQGLKVGEMRVSGPTDQDNIVADILNGDAQTGDEVRVR